MFGSEIALDKSEKPRTRHKSDGKKCFLLPVFRRDQTDYLELPDETCQSLTHGENLSIRKSVAVSPPISISLPFSAPPQDHEGYSLPKKNNLSSAKIFTAIMRKSLAFI